MAVPEAFTCLNLYAIHSKIMYDDLYYTSANQGRRSIINNVWNKILGMDQLNINKF